MPPGALPVPDGPWPGTVRLHLIWPASSRVGGPFVSSSDQDRPYGQAHWNEPPDPRDGRSTGGCGILVQTRDKRLYHLLNVWRDVGVVRPLGLDKLVRRALAGRQLKKLTRRKQES